MKMHGKDISVNMTGFKVFLTGDNIQVQALVQLGPDYFYICLMERLKTTSYYHYEHLQYAHTYVHKRKKLYNLKELNLGLALAV